MRRLCQSGSIVSICPDELHTKLYRFCSLIGEYLRPMKNSRPLVVIGLLGPTLDAGRDQKRWNRWRPTVGLHMQDDLVVSRFEMLPAAV